MFTNTKHTLRIIPFLICGIMLLFCQKVFTQKTTTFSLGLGGTYSSFQDTRTSNIQYAGFGIPLEFKLNSSGDSNMWEGALLVNYSSEKTSLFDKKGIQVIYPQIHFSYLKSINKDFFVGGRWDIIELNFRNNSLLTNSKIYYNVGSFLGVSGLYRTNLLDKKLEIGLNVGLLGFMKELGSFSFPVSQQILDNGKLDLTDDNIPNPLGLNYYSLRGGWDYVRVSTSFLWKFSKRFSAGYQWQFRRITETDNYPVSTGHHNMIFRWNIISKTKGKKTILD